MNTISHYLKGQSAAARLWIYLALLGAAQILALVTGMSHTGAMLLAGAVLVGVDVAIWLRNNPTIKQMQRRRTEEERGHSQ